MATLILCRPDRIGDVIIATACLEPLRRQRPDDRLVFVAREVMRPLLEGHPLLAGFLALPSARPALRWTHGRPGDWPRALAAWHADAMVHFHPDAAAQAAARAAGIPRRLGYRSSFLADRTLTDRLPDRRGAGAKHEAEYNFELLAPLGIETPPPGALRPSVHLPDSWRQSLRIRLAALGFDGFERGDEPYAVLNPTAYSPDHRWPPAHFAWLALELLKSGRFPRVFLVGENVNDPSAREIRRLLGEGVAGLIDLTGETNLAELGCLLRHAALLVSRNTGTTHLAAAVGCQTVELFGRLEGRYGPTRWRALGPRNEVVTTPAAARRRLFESRRAFWRRGHATIPRDAVLAAAIKLADTRPAGAEGSHTQT